ncbi:class I SAM-dependent methyltransferase [Nonomuraea rubra]|uniref:SAM-dependent methyltransferase n=2 Tax=Nonomuraea rubra TaxID=46180 RepID=A0A7X0U0L2_9ACTN|nr:class I SAM-dependent methyltransferase [Nonomuraea rubra]MBB6550726.1 SAM-dependent methyltransferase [Nonomuraea rubra]
MTHAFDKDYWEQHWHGGEASMGGHPPNPYLAPETVGLAPGTALDAGCGSGAEAIWLAERGWHVTAADISSHALAAAARRPASGDAAGRLHWVRADLTTWRPDAPFDLVMTHYAHPAMPQLDFYDRIAGWVAPGGTLLIVGHLHTHDTLGHTHDAPGAGGPTAGHAHTPGAATGHAHSGAAHSGAAAGHGHHPPAEASATPAAITARLPRTQWDIVTAQEHVRTLPGRPVPLHDVVVRATRHR